MTLGMKYTLYIDDNFHYMDEDERYKFGEFSSLEKAIARAKQIVDAFLVQAYKKGMTAHGPWNFLGTLSVFTGYFQDRLSPGITGVWDISTQSGALITSVSYRFTQNFSAAIGMLFLYGKPDFVDEPLEGLAPAGNRSRADADHLYKSGREGGLAIVRDRDEIWARIRYTF